jgi:DNA-binding PadR family transcriptional regulator
MKGSIMDFHEHHGDRRGFRRHVGEARQAFGGFQPPFPPGVPGFGPFGHGGHHGRGGYRGERRGRRGNVRAAILALLTERSMHGYEMIQELDQRTGGVWRPSPGSIYPTLQLLEDEGLITSSAEGTGSRKSYSLTEAGQAEAATAAQNAPWDAFSAETVSSGHDTREAIGGIMMALRQIAYSHNPEQWQKAVEVLNETRRKLYAILADSE